MLNCAGVRMASLSVVEAAKIVRAQVGGGEQAAACAGGEGPACAEGQRCC